MARVVLVPRTRTRYICAVRLPETLLRKRRRLYSQAEIARIVGVAQTVVSELERDCDRVRPETLRAYLSVLGWRVRISPKDRRTGGE